MLVLMAMNFFCLKIYVDYTLFGLSVIIGPCCKGYRPNYIEMCI
uniref:Uncharacterized protein n=1 Tax=Arundo donax TaxID=35708 RepID=A0A0A8ZIH8_ARUDO